MRQAFGGSMSAVRNREGIVDEDIRQFCQRSGGWELLGDDDFTRFSQRLLAVLSPLVLLTVPALPLLPPAPAPARR